MICSLLMRYRSFEIIHHLRAGLNIDPTLLYLMILLKFGYLLHTSNFCLQHFGFPVDILCCGLFIFLKALLHYIHV